MSLKSSSDRYGAVAIAIHWISAAAILTLLAIGFLAARSDDPALTAALLRVHVPLGTLVLALTLFRLIWRYDRRPGPLPGLPRWQEAVERGVRVLLYLLLVVMGASGIGLLVLSGAAPILFFGAPAPLPDFSQFLPMTTHMLAAFALLGLAGLHIAAAVYHQALRRDGVMARMGVGTVRQTLRAR